MRQESDRNVSVLKTCVADKLGLPYEANLKNMLRSRIWSIEGVAAKKDSFMVGKREINDFATYRRLLANDQSVYLQGRRPIHVTQTTYACERRRHRESQSWGMANFSLITAQAFQDELGVDVLITSIEKVGPTKSPLGFKKSMVFTSYMG